MDIYVFFMYLVDIAPWWASLFVGASADGGGMPELCRDSYTGLGEGLSSKIVEV